MRRLLASLALSAAVGAGGLVAAGCGEEELAGPDVAKAAAATADKGTARVTARISVQTDAIPLPLDVKGTGVMALEEAKGALTFDFGPLLQLAGTAGVDGKVDVRFLSGMVWAKPPKLEQLAVPGGKSWVALDLPQLGEALDLPTKGLGKLFTLEPAAQLRALQSAKGLKEVGKEEIDGAETTHFRGTYRLTDFVKTLPADEQADVKAAIARLDELTGDGESVDEPLPADLWVDEDGVMRRIQSTSKFPAQDGQPGGTLKQSFDFTDFGVAVDVEPPPAGETYDATPAASEALEGLSAMGAATP